MVTRNPREFMRVPGRLVGDGAEPDESLDAWCFLRHGFPFIGPEDREHGPWTRCGPGRRFTLNGKMKARMDE